MRRGAAPPRGAVALATALALALAGVVADAARATDGNLPGGTSISVDIATPASGTQVPAPGSVDLTGTASVGTAAPRADTTLVYVVDVSGSTGRSGGCGGDQNGDGALDTVLDCEIAAGRELNQRAIAAGTVDQVGAVFFNHNATIRDTDPVAAGRRA